MSIIIRILSFIILVIIVPLFITIYIVDAMYWNEAMMLLIWVVLTGLALVLVVKSWRKR